jgi:hypothetical protein
VDFTAAKGSKWRFVGFFVWKIPVFLKTWHGSCLHITETLRMKVKKQANLFGGLL